MMDGEAYVTLYWESAYLSTGLAYCDCLHYTQEIFARPRVVVTYSQ